MTLDFILIGIGWMLAVCSSVVLLRKYPGRPIGRGYPSGGQRGWRSNGLLGVAIFIAFFGGAGLEDRHGWGLWAVPAVSIPLFTFATVPIIFRRRQLRRSTMQV